MAENIDVSLLIIKTFKEGISPASYSKHNLGHTDVRNPSTSKKKLVDRET